MLLLAAIACLLHFRPADTSDPDEAKKPLPFKKKGDYAYWQDDDDFFPTKPRPGTRIVPDPKEQGVGVLAYKKQFFFAIRIRAYPPVSISAKNLRKFVKIFQKAKIFHKYFCI
jgi:hypothetical protein